MGQAVLEQRHLITGADNLSWVGSSPYHRRVCTGSSPFFTLLHILLAVNRLPKKRLRLGLSLRKG